MIIDIFAIFFPSKKDYRNLILAALFFSYNLSSSCFSFEKLIRRSGYCSSGSFNSPVSYTHLDVYKRQIPDICCPHDFTITRKNPSLRIPSIRPSPDMESLMPATLTTEASTLQSKSGSHLQDLGSVSCMQNHVPGKARARLKSSIRWWMTLSVNRSLKISGHWKN